MVKKTLHSSALLLSLSLMIIVPVYAQQVSSEEAQTQEVTPSPTATESSPTPVATQESQLLDPTITTQQGRISVAPALHEVVLKERGSEVPVEFTYTNSTDQTVTLEFFTQDFKQVDLSSRVLFVPNEDEYNYALASFLSLEANTLTLEPQESKKFLVTVVNRDDLSPGGHYAAVVARLKSDTQDNITKIAPAVSSLLLLRKEGGEIFNMELLESDFPSGNIVNTYPDNFTIQFQNQGNVHLVPHGTVYIYDILNRMIYDGTINVQGSAVFPGTRKNIETSLQKIAYEFPISINRMQINGRDSLNKIFYTESYTYIYISRSAYLFLGAICLLLAAFVARKVILRRKKRS